MTFDTKNILLIGASSGIGNDLLSRLNEKGATIYAASRTEGLTWPNGVKYQKLDVLENVTSLGSFLPAELHGLVYSVGSINLKPFSRITEGDLMKDYQLNVIGAAMSIQQALPALKAAKSASIVLISSVAAQTGMGFHTSIAAAKAGLEGFATSLAAELATYGIRVNVVAPSLTDTPLASALLSSDEKKLSAAKRHPIGRFGKVNDISSAIEFLLSDDGSWITGQVIAVDGGMSSLRTNL